MHLIYNPVVATQRLLRQPARAGRAPESRPADSMVQIISILGARRRDLRASTGERLRLLAARTPPHIELEERLAGLEQRLESARLAQAQRNERRRARIVRLRELLETLRGPRAGTSRQYQLGSVLMYVGGLAVLWVILLELGLALGLR